LLLGFVQFVPMPNHFRTAGVLQSRQWSEALTEAPGYLDKIIAPPGSQVISGQPLVQLRNEELELEFAAAHAKVDEIETRLRQALQESTPNLRPLNSLLESATLKLKHIEANKAALIIYARHAGIWTSPKVTEYVGRWIAKGTALGQIIDPSGFEFVAPVAQEDANGLFGRTISVAQVRLVGQSENVLTIDKFQVIPAERRRLPSAALGWAGGGEVPVQTDDTTGEQALEPFFEVRAIVQSDSQVIPLHGRSGKIRFTLEDEPLLPRGVRWLRQLMQKRYQL
jgi:putative peptide zinc metalloprotease protein